MQTDHDLKPAWEALLSSFSPPPGEMECPVMYPTKEEFSLPFCDYVRKACKENPDFAVFKVVPPAGWAPRKGPVPDLQDIRIETPIMQYVSHALAAVHQQLRAMIHI